MSEIHVIYPHEPGRLFDCPACEARCHCTPDPGTTLCVFDGAHIRGITRRDGVAGQYAVTVMVQHDDDQPAAPVTFTTSTYGGPVVMSTPGNPGGVFVSREVSERLGSVVDEAWVRGFFR